MSVVKEGWTYKKLGEVCEVLNGFAFKSELFKNSGLPILRISNIQDNRIVDDGFVYFDKSSYPKIDLNKYKVNPTELVIAMSGATTGKVGINSTSKILYLNQRVGLLREDSTLLKKKYLFYFMQTKSSESLEIASGVAQPNLSTKQIKDFQIPVPPLPTQQSIVSELDKINELIALKESQLKDLDALAQSIFYDMFGDPITNEKGWEVKKMEDLCTNIVDCPHSTPKKSDSVTKYPCIRTSELKGGSISWDTMQYLEKEEYEIRIARLKPEAGDIVFGREGTIGDAVILPKGYNFSLGQRTMLLRANTEIISNVFLLKVILSEWIKLQIEYVNVSSTVAHVNIKDFKQFTVPLPPLSLQHQFAERVESIERMKQQVQTAIKELETLLASRMQYWFD